MDRTLALLLTVLSLPLAPLAVLAWSTDTFAVALAAITSGTARHAESVVAAGHAPTSHAPTGKPVRAPP